MTAKEFLDSKYPGQTKFDEYDVIFIMDEYHAIASGQKVDVDKKFENLTEKYESNKTIDKGEVLSDIRKCIEMIESYLKKGL